MDLPSGGPDSAIYRSLDGGETWQDLGSNTGLPRGVMGKIGLSASPACGGRIWALIEADEGGVYRSDDYGETWTWLSDERNFMVRARFSITIRADPVDANTVYVVSRKLWKSTDGGRTFGQLNVPYVDQHDLWLDPRDPRRMILGNDGGAAVSFDAGRTWSTLRNQPTAEIYRITADSHVPYRVYGSQQDNSTLCLPHHSERAGLSELEWYDIGGGESGYIAVRPDDPNVVYSSDLPGLGITRYDHRNFQLREIGPWGEPGAWDKDPRVDTTQSEYDAQYTLLIRIRDRVTAIHSLIGRLRRIRRQLEDRLPYLDAGDDMRRRGHSLIDALTGIEETLIQPRLNENSGELDGTHFPDRIDGKLQALSYQVARSDNAPTDQAVALWESLQAQADSETARFERLMAEDLFVYNAISRERDLPIVVV